MKNKWLQKYKYFSKCWNFRNAVCILWPKSQSQKHWNEGPAVWMGVGWKSQWLLTCSRV